MKALGLIIILAFALPQVAHADFSVQCYAPISRCAGPIADLVTEKFVKSFPDKKWQIAVIAEFHTYSDGGGVGFAVAGVVPKNSGLVPLKRFSASIRIDRTRKVGAMEVENLVLDVYREAVSQLMAACERTKDCDVYLGR
jgi:hypothetical protein